MINEDIFYAILKSREDRSLMQEEIIHKYNLPIISFTLNIPGPKKDSLEYRNIHNIGMDIISKTLKGRKYNIEYMESTHKTTGSEGYFSLDIDSLELKRITVKIENEHPLGRLFDIDVFDSNHRQISRSDLDLSPRKCILCEEIAKVCNRSKAHTLEELIEEINKIYNLYFNK